MDSDATKQVYDILAKAAQICVEQDITVAVLCPGSRSAPVALSFLRNKNIKSYILPDERSAAYTALGLAKALQKPVILVCTSGTAALNFAPAIAEAFFSEIPLLVLTADRPQEWLGQADNQAIYQQNLYGKHVKQSYTFPLDLEHADSQWFALRQLNEAINFSTQKPAGPVHINIPLREPLYLTGTESFLPKEIPYKVTKLAKTKAFLDDSIYAELKKFKRIICIAGMNLPDENLQEIISENTAKYLVFIADITSNLHDTKNSLLYAELVLDNEAFTDEFSPDLIISFGGPIVSKTIKQFLRKSNAKHWHVGFSPAAADTFQKLDKILPIEPEAFFHEAIYAHNIVFDYEYFQSWQNAQNSVINKLKPVLENLPFSEVKAAYKILDKLPENSVLHSGNSLPIRYAAAFPSLPKNVQIFANRGTSGIDGSLSTAAGFSIFDSTKLNVLILGDLSFLYDSNGLWNNYLQSNLKIIVFNNHGGGIFRNLPGSAVQPELEEYFVVKQPLRMEGTAIQHNCRYIYCNDEKCFAESLELFFGENERPAILEIEFSEALKISEVKALLKS
ncbi:MAG: 2-succinyl-5-enolpyruvyl-6-hydroxy-3-cyclohexene-1-carboxylic-acid synthase [Sphingobacteriales bacterium]|nr:MAG: 2-succinyl-5-enolpyruvyl-6-hydroxy-3-cyclohexene-1-carboxylic-acid synthase [Sphingobacteriales bacterium]